MFLNLVIWRTIIDEMNIFFHISLLLSFLAFRHTVVCQNEIWGIGEKVIHVTEFQLLKRVQYVCVSVLGGGGG